MRKMISQAKGGHGATVTWYQDTLRREAEIIKGKNIKENIFFNKTL